MLRLVPLLLLAGSLAACGDGDGNGTQISIKADTGDGNLSASTDANGALAVKIPGLDARIKLPPIQVKADDFDVNGVKLYPQSRILGMNVDAKGDSGDKQQGTVEVRFDSPAGPDRVRGWFEQQMRAHGFHVQRSGSGLSGTTNEGDPFRLEIAPNGTNQASGALTVRG
jgi:hypothetical protein